ncbi:MM3350-like domain-containing protein [Trichophaea hybrida]|nr:MM3350-like domain-containing protein [Trichophaea hybrida]
MPLPTYTHPRAGQVWIKIDPRDDLTGLPRAYLKNPEEHVPEINSNSGKIEAWGINEQDPSDDGLPPALMRQMMTQGYYMSRECPEKQFIKLLMDRKIKALAERGEGDRAKRDYILKITMPKIANKKGEEFIWRRIKVSGSTKLAVLQDKIIQPAMGWCRNYHGYLFTDRADGAMFGPKDAGHIDMMHLYLNGHDYIPDTKYTLANVLPEEGSALGYCYDLGDHFMHEITVEKILPADEYTGKVELLDGRGACPPEDGCGNHTYQPLLEKIYAGDKDTIKEIARSSNYRDDPRAKNWASWKFDPEAFDVEEARKRIEVALQSKASVPSGAKKFVVPVGGGPVDETLEGPPKRGTRRVINPGDFGYMTETVADRPDRRGTALCDNCGKPEGLKRCSGCGQIWYCGKECQRARWKSHKPLCGK